MGSIHRCEVSAQFLSPTPSGEHIAPFFKFPGVFAKALLAFLAGKGHVEALEEGVVFCLLVAFCAVEPFATWAKVTGLFVREGRYTHSMVSGWRLGRSGCVYLRGESARGSRRNQTAVK